jgi:hypothetical protein
VEARRQVEKLTNYRDVSAAGKIATVSVSLAQNISGNRE